MTHTWLFVLALFVALLYLGYRWYTAPVLRVDATVIDKWVMYTRSAPIPTIKVQLPGGRVRTLLNSKDYNLVQPGQTIHLFLKGGLFMVTSCTTPTKGSRVVPFKLRSAEVQ